MQSVIPGGGSVVLTAGRLVMELFCTLLEMTIVNTGGLENLALITVQSSHVANFVLCVMVLHHDSQSQGAQLRLQ
jgi:hypothetical protein